MKIHYVTGNKGKFDEAVEILQPASLEELGFQIVHTPLHLEEIQGTSQSIALHKIAQSYKILGEPCLIDDISLCCPAIGGLPGPYVRSFLESIGDEGIARLISLYEDKSCKVVCHIAFMSEKGDPLLFEGELYGNIVFPRGQRKAHTHSWNAIVEPLGSTLTFAEMPLVDASKISARSKALTHFRNYLLAL